MLAQFTKNRGREVKAVTKDGEKIQGILQTVSADEIVIETSKMIKPEGKKKKELVVEQHVYPMIEIKEVKIQCLI